MAGKKRSMILIGRMKSKIELEFWREYFYENILIVCFIFESSQFIKVVFIKHTLIWPNDTWITFLSNHFSDFLTDHMTSLSDISD